MKNSDEAFVPWTAADHAADFGDLLGKPDCLDSRPTSPCEGPIEFREPLSATGRSFPRCDRHWDERLVTQERINRRYPDSPVPPAWFDPADAGEHWDSDY